MGNIKGFKDLTELRVLWKWVSFTKNGDVLLDLLIKTNLARAMSEFEFFVALQR